MEIKTIVKRLDNAAEFDAAVNAAIADGWALSRRTVLTPAQPNCSLAYFHTMLYAELVKLDEPVEQVEPTTWQEAVDVLRNTCASTAECDESCTMHAWCDSNLADDPASWTQPEVVAE